MKPFGGTGKSLSEALLFAKHGKNMLCTKIVLNVRNTVHNMFSQGLSFEFSCLELVIQWTIVILWVSWCKNKCFWKRFTCIFIPTYTNCRSYTFISFLENFLSILLNLLTFETLACILFKKFEKEKKTHSWVFVWSQKTIIRKKNYIFVQCKLVTHS